MAKLPITPPTYAVDNVQQLPDIVIGDAPVVKATHDKTGSDGKDYIIDTLITELNGSTGANMIGHSNPNIASNNVADAVEEVRQIAVQAQAGSIVDNSIGNIKLEADIKVGSLALSTTTNKLSVIDVTNEIDANADTAQATATSANNLATSVSTILNIARTAKTSTGSAVAYAVDTDGTFDLTKDGNRLMFVPNVANSGSCTITTDTNDAKGTRKANDAGTYVVLEAGDVKQGVPTEFVWSVSNDFFILRPSGGGSNIKSIQRGTTLIDNAFATATATISSIDPLKSIIYMTYKSTSGSQATALVSAEITNNTTVTFKRGDIGAPATAYWTVIEFNNVKSKQSGSVASTSASFTATITSVDLAKSLLISTARSTNTVANGVENANVGAILSSQTQISFNQGYAVQKTAEWQVIEFK